MPGNDEQLFTELEKEMEKSHVTFASMDEMMRNAADGLDYAEKGRKLYAVADYRRSEPDDGSIDVAFQSRLQNSESQGRADIVLRDAIKRQRIETSDKAEIEKELNCRAKEESYTNKKGDQEKDAKARNEQLADVSQEELKEKAVFLRDRLSHSADEDDDDTTALGQREYEKQYLAVIEDLIKTQDSKGKLFGNYKSHIALAKEKYYFYTRESERIIGKEQAKLLMGKEEYKTNLDRGMQAEGFPDLMTVLKGINLQEIKTRIGEKGYAVLKQAILEYREYSYKVFTLKKELEALKATAEQTETARRQRLAAAGISGEDFRYRSGLGAFKRSVEAEMNVWKFHADACALCINRLANPGIVPVIDGAYCAHAGYVREHFGVKLDDIESDVPVRLQRISRRIGFESGESDFADRMNRHAPDYTFFPDKVMGSVDESLKKLEKAGITPTLNVMHDDRYNNTDSETYGYGRNVNPLYRATGLGVQRFFERQAFESSLEDIPDMIVADKKLRGKAAESMKETCESYAYILQDLPAVTEVKDERTGVSRTKMLYHGYRDANGSFEAYADTPKSADELNAQKKTLADFVNSMLTIRESENKEEVKKAIKDVLPALNKAFSDIDAFMTVGKTREIFTAKSHEEVFDNTAGLPTFERKTRFLRDSFSLILGKKESLQAVADEARDDQLTKKMHHKWMFLNRALSFVDYRLQVMEKGYESTPEEWAQDTTVVESFWDKVQYERTEEADKIGEFLEGLHKSPELLGTEVSDENAQPEEEDQPAEEQASEESEEAVDILSVPVEDEEDSWSEEDKKTWRRWKAELKEAAEKSEKRKRDWDAALAGFSMAERRFLRPEYYESAAFTTRQQQKDAIFEDLLKASDHATYVAELALVTSELKEKRDKLSAKPNDAGLTRICGDLDERRKVIEKEISDIVSGAQSKAAEILDCAAEPVSEQEELKKSVNTLIAQASQKSGADPNSAGSAIDREEINLAARAMPLLMALKASVDDPNYDEGTVRQRLKDAWDALMPGCLEGARQRNLELFRYIKDTYSRDELPKQEVIRIMDSYSEMCSKPIDDPSVLFAMYHKAFRHLSSMEQKSGSFKRIFIFQLFNELISVKNKIEYMGEKKANKVLFEEKVEIAEFDQMSGEMHGPVYEGTLTEEEGRRNVLSERHGMETEANSVASKLATNQLASVKAAVETIKTERKQFKVEIERMIGTSVNSLIEKAKPDADEKAVLDSLGSILVRMGEKTSDPQGILVSVTTDPNVQEKKTEALVNAFIKLMDDNTSDDELKIAEEYLLNVVRVAYSDVGDFLQTDYGSKIVMERKQGDFSYTGYGRAAKDNYTEGVKGMAGLEIRTDSLFEAVKLLLSRDDRLSQEVRSELEDMRSTLEELIDYLNWREGIFDAIQHSVGAGGSGSTVYSSPDEKGRMKIDMVNGVRTVDYIHDVRDNPEEWNHPAFVWKKK